MTMVVSGGLNELMADCGTLNTVSWTPPQKMTYEQWAEVGRRFQQIDGSLNWWLGDWLNEGEKRYGETYTQAVEVTGHRVEHLKNCKWVAGKVGKSLRNDFLSWTHHYYVARLDNEAQQALLQYASDNGLSSRELLEAVRKYEQNLQQEYEPDATVVPVTARDEYDPDFDPPTANQEYYRLGDDEADDEEDEPSPRVPHVAHNSGNNEWYTPAEYIEAARAVMGSIDLDPASSLAANEVVKAKNFYTVEDDGLAYQWHGKVWMNPPYAKGLVESFAEKLAYHHGMGDISQAIVLVNNATETGWFQTLIDCASAIVFPRSRVRFWKENGESGDPLQGQAIIYMGPNVDRFRVIFEAFGWSAAL